MTQINWNYFKEALKTYNECQTKFIEVSFEGKNVIYVSTPDSYRDNVIMFLEMALICILRTMSKTKITINNNGSVKLDGDFEIVDMHGSAYGLQGRTIVSLCRCGRSANKPFCDGSHNGNFEHEATAFDLPPKKV